MSFQIGDQVRRKQEHCGDMFTKDTIYTIVAIQGRDVRISDGVQHLGAWYVAARFELATHYTPFTLRLP